MACKAQYIGTEEERIALSLRLDKELDDFIAKKKKSAYKDGLKPEEWDKEIESHPFFMKEVPEGEELPPLLQGLQEIKYSPDSNTADDLAVAYKDDGNFNFKHKNYRKAVIAYSEGLKQPFNNSHLKAQLYNNRAAANIHLENFRSAYSDCKLALKETPNYTKAKKTLAQACKALGLYNECISTCDDLLLIRSDQAIHELRKQAVDDKKKLDRNKRKEQAMQRKKNIELTKLKEMINSRGIKFLSDPFWEKPETELPNKVYVEKDHLVWPVVFLYPEYKTSDVIQHFHEDNRFEEHLSQVFADFPEWDEEKKYTLESVVIHYEDPNGKIHSVEKTSTLRSVLSEPDFRVDGCSPAFLLHAKGSAAFDSFLKNYE
uniref:Tetratricopeptide repeat protein, putative n=1 Tax=Riptortus pedestris TaxID=329032 RepID=R4WU30_RIPPE|nr:tetratricopeptide repeat protein, putative [Riptortus pedestris]